MAKVKSLAELKAMREKLQSKLDLREKSNDPDSLVQIKVAMATCGIAAGAKQVMEHMMEKAEDDRVAAGALHLDGRFGVAVAHATGLGEDDTELQLIGLLHHVFHHLLGASGDTAGSHSNLNLHQ